MRNNCSEVTHEFDVNVPECIRIVQHESEEVVWLGNCKVWCLVELCFGTLAVEHVY